jgi:hypothetical protein
LNNYATTNALSSYRLISDSWSKGDTTNEILIRVGNMGTNSDGSITTAKQYTDNATSGLSATIATNAAVTTGLVASVATMNSTLTVIEGEIATLQGEVSGLETDVTALKAKTQNQTATVGNTVFTGTLQMSNGVANNITINQNGDIACLTETLNTLTCNTQITGNGKLNLSNTQDHVLNGNSITLSQAGKNTQVYGNVYAGAVGSTIQLYGDTLNINNSSSLTNFTTTNIGGLFQTVYLNGYVYINGRLVTGFGIGGTNGQWNFANT